MNATLGACGLRGPLKEDLANLFVIDISLMCSLINSNNLVTVKFRKLVYLNSYGLK